MHDAPGQAAAHWACHTIGGLPLYVSYAAAALLVLHLSRQSARGWTGQLGRVGIAFVLLAFPTFLRGSGGTSGS